MIDYQLMTNKPARYTILEEKLVGIEIRQLLCQLNCCPLKTAWRNTEIIIVQLILLSKMENLRQANRG